MKVEEEKIGREGRREGGKSVVEGGGGEKVRKNTSGPSQLIPENTILKLKDKPGEHMIAKYLL